MAAVVALTYHCLHSEGFLAHAGATEGIVRAHLTNFIDKVAIGEIPELLETETIFVDARFPRDFRAGHIGKAINVPTFFGEKERGEAMANVAKNRYLVVYCQSNGCGFAEKVALSLIGDGYGNLAIFKGGWREWAESRGLSGGSGGRCGS